MEFFFSFEFVTNFWIYIESLISIWRMPYTSVMMRQSLPWQHCWHRPHRWWYPLSISSPCLPHHPQWSNYDLPDSHALCLLKFIKIKMNHKDIILLFFVQVHLLWTTTILIFWVIEIVLNLACFLKMNIQYNHKGIRTSTWQSISDKISVTETV